QAARWRSQHTVSGGLRLDVGGSSDLLLGPRFPDALRTLLGECGLEAAGLIIEISETALLDQVDAITRRLAELRELGVGLALSGFGTGHSSLTTLRQLPVDILKIGAPLIGGLTRSADGPGLVLAVVNIAQALELEMIAEGVEDAAQAEMLVEMGVQMGQGDLYHRP